MTNPRIPIAKPDLSGNEARYLKDCVDTSWISARGPFVDRFEQSFAAFTGISHCVAVINGTAALHLILMALGVGPGDEVVVPSLTYVATANAVKYTGALPVFADSDLSTWNISPKSIDDAITAKTKAVIPVHLYGAAADMEAIRSVCNEKGISVVEDATEALGTYVGSDHSGALGVAGAFSFFANKTVTTGEGGMVATDDAELAHHVRVLMDQGESPVRKYMHDIVGYNYRMTNMQAAIGTAQMERIHHFVKRKRQIHEHYHSVLHSSRITFAATYPGSIHSHWMTSVVIEGISREIRDEIITELDYHGIEARPFFFPIHLMPPYRRSAKQVLPNCEDLSSRGISLPSYSMLSDADVEYICNSLTSALESRI